MVVATVQAVAGLARQHKAAPVVVVHVVFIRARLQMHQVKVTLVVVVQEVVVEEAVALDLLVGIDRLMSQCRSFTNLIGNGVATVVISRWEKEVSAETVRAHLRPSS